MATIYDVSKKTGFSIATVSKVINNYTGVSPKTRKLIEEAIKELDFTPNTTARTLATKKSWLIAIILGEESGFGITHPHFSDILKGFQEKSATYGYDTVFLNSFMGEKKMSYLEHCKYRNVDGVLVAQNAKFTENISSLLNSEIPIVSVETEYPEIPTVISDNKLGAKQALEHLYLLGHRKIAHISSPTARDSQAGRERYEAYVEFLEENNLEFNARYVAEATRYNPSAGEVAANKLLQQCWDDLPTAIFTSSDGYALACINVLKERGFLVPEDISVVGFDDLPYISYIKPGLTTVRQDRNEIGQKAAKILVDIIEKKDIAPGIVRIPTELIVRQTTKRYREKEL